MKMQTLYRLGAVAMIAVAVVSAILNLNYFIGGDAALNTLPMAWLDMALNTFLVFSIIALYAVQRESSGVIGFGAFVLLILGMLVSCITSGLHIAVVSGPVAQSQIEQVGSYSFLLNFGRYTYVAGVILLGYTTARSGLFPVWAGVLLALIGVLNLFTGLGTVVQYLFAAVASIAWIALGWVLWNTPLESDVVESREPVSAPAH